MNVENNLKFLKSALSQYQIEEKKLDTLEWLRRKNDEINIEIEITKFSELKDWVFDDEKQNLAHVSGKFFSIDGIDVSTNYSNINNWQQPIINQPEIGFLGIIAKEINGILHFLMQAKVEPGNVNYVQLSPTLQATKSNYSQVHNGKKPLFLELFLDSNKTILLDQLQSEQGARFLKKRNRNIIIQIFNDIQFNSDFKWLTLAQIISLMQFDNIVNMDTRTVISGINFGSIVSSDFNFFVVSNTLKNYFGINFLKSSLLTVNSKNTIEVILSWFTEQKVKYDLQVKKVDIKLLNQWVVSDTCIEHKEGKYFKVIPVSVKISNREVSIWNQPLVQPVQEGICAFIIKEINGIFHFLVQAKLECGNYDTVEMAPTVQCLTGNYNTKTGGLPPIFLEQILNAKQNQIVFDTLQSEEGGRFYREQNRNLIVILENEIDTDDIPTNFIWLTLQQIKVLLQYNNYFNIQARSLISAIKF